MKNKNEYGLFVYKIDDNPGGCDECVYREYFTNKKKAILKANSLKRYIRQSEYLEVWKKENDMWGASGEPILKSDN